VTTKGRLLVATPSLGDPNFERSVILMLEHSDEGALGLVLNRPSALEVDDPLPDWASLAASPGTVFVGGPVSRESVIALARCTDDADLDDEVFTPIVDGVGVLDLTSDAVTVGLSLLDVRVFAGYAGWGGGQLEGEIDEGAWWVFDIDRSDVMTAEPEGLWRAVLRRQPPPMRLFAHYPDHPSFN
jgi:putative transcriptional regulator